MVCKYDRGLEVIEAVMHEIETNLWVAQGMSDGERHDMLGMSVTADELRSGAQALGMDLMHGAMRRHWFVREPDKHNAPVSFNAIRLVDQGGYKPLRDQPLQLPPAWLPAHMRDQVVTVQ